MHIAFIGFGEAARAFVDSLAATGDLAFSTYDILFASEGGDGVTAAAARARRVVPAGDAPSAIADADWVFLAVTAASSLEAARSIAGGLRAGQVVFDINSVSPARKAETARLVTGRGALYVDMAVMAPVHPAGHRTPAFIAGAIPTAVEAALEQLDFRLAAVGPTPGDAAAVKMVRSLFVKGLEAITVEALLAARLSGCSGRVMTSLSGSFPGLGWPDFAAYQVERMMRHGVRRAAEMTECAATLDDLGLDGELARAVAGFHGRIGALGLRAGDDLEETLDRLAAAIHSAGG